MTHDAIIIMGWNVKEERVSCNNFIETPDIGSRELTFEMFAEW
jgi:hypothetical protein